MWINLHTHRKPRETDEWVLRNAFLRVPETRPLYALSFGMHPWWITKTFVKQLPALAAALQHPNCRALGECGLDRLRGPEISIQTEAFEAQLELAALHEKPVIIHAVRTYSDVLGMKRYRKTPWIIHGFKGSWTEAKKLLDQDIRLSVGPRMLHDAALQELLQQLPAESLYLETDTRNVAIRDMYKTAAHFRQLAVEDLRMQIKTNFERDFKGYLNG